MEPILTVIVKQDCTLPSSQPQAQTGQQGQGTPLQVIDLGSMSYAPACARQREVREALIQARDQGDRNAPMTLLLVEHDPPVITLSHRPGAQSHLVASPEKLRQLGIEVCETDRGGDITYHGPGQLVAYPILDLKQLGLGVAAYLRFLEQIVIDTLAHFDIKGEREPSATGVWVGHSPSTAGKICAIGVRVGRWVTMHGLALNVTTDLSHFDTIVPCGLAGRSVTSIERELTKSGRAVPPMKEVKRALSHELTQAVKARIVSSAADRID